MGTRDITDASEQESPPLWAWVLVFLLSMGIVWQILQTIPGAPTRQDATDAKPPALEFGAPDHQQLLAL